MSNKNNKKSSAVVLYKPRPKKTLVVARPAPKAAIKKVVEREVRKVDKVNVGAFERQHRVEEMNAIAYVRSVMQPFSVPPMRLPSQQIIPTCILRTFQNLRVAGVVDSVSTNNMYFGLQFAGGTKSCYRLILSVASGVITWDSWTSFSQDSAMSTNFDVVRAIAGGVIYEDASSELYRSGNWYVNTIALEASQFDTNAEILASPYTRIANASSTNTIQIPWIPMFGGQTSNTADEQYITEWHDPSLLSNDMTTDVVTLYFAGGTNIGASLVGNITLMANIEAIPQSGNAYLFDTKAAPGNLADVSTAFRVMGITSNRTSLVNFSSKPSITVENNSGRPFSGKAGPTSFEGRAKKMRDQLWDKAWNYGKQKLLDGAAWAFGLGGLTLLKHQVACMLDADQFRANPHHAHSERKEHPALRDDTVSLEDYVKLILSYPEEPSSPVVTTVSDADKKIKSKKLGYFS